MGSNGGSRNSYHSAQASSVQSGTDGTEVGSTGASWSVPATSTASGRAVVGSAPRAAHVSEPRPPPPPPVVLLSAEKADLIAQTAAHVAQNGESFVQVLLDQGPDFSFLRGSAPDRPDSLGHAYYTNCLRYELDRNVSPTRTTRRDDGTRGTSRSSSTAPTKHTLRTEDNGEDTDDQEVAGW
jgi:hypothetical protein